MAFSANGLILLSDGIGGKFRLWAYQSTDAFSDVDATDYFTDGEKYGLQEGDFMIAIETDTTPPKVTLATVTGVDSDGNATVSALSTALGDLEVTGNVGFYGTTAISQRAGSAQATSALATSSDFGATQLAALVEVMDTLTALGLWKGEA